MTSCHKSWIPFAFKGRDKRGSTSGLQKFNLSTINPTVALTAPPAPLRTYSPDKNLFQFLECKRWNRRPPLRLRSCNPAPFRKTSQAVRFRGPKNPKPYSRRPQNVFQAHRNSFRWGPLYIDIGLEQIEATTDPQPSRNDKRKRAPSV